MNIHYIEYLQISPPKSFPSNSTGDKILEKLVLKQTFYYDPRSPVWSCSWRRRSSRGRRSLTPSTPSSGGSTPCPGSVGTFPPFPVTIYNIIQDTSQDSFIDNILQDTLQDSFIDNILQDTSQD